MAEFVQLDKAAALVGKSEVTLRRLVKAGKIPFEKEKTLTGFIYRVDPEKVRDFYRGREGYISEAISEEPEAQVGKVEVTSEASGAHAVRIAVAGESGNAYEYWQKKSDLYEERYNNEVAKHSHTREELGVWRGRAEQAQSMLMKLLPAPQEVEIRQQTAESSVGPTSAHKAASEGGSLAVTVLIAFLSALVAVAAGAAVYVRFFM